MNHRQERPTVLCLCPEIYNWKLLPSYANAFRNHGWDFSYLESDFSFDTPLPDVLARCSRPPNLIIHFDSGLPLLPYGLEESLIPTMRYDVDTHTFMRRRFRWASLFDLVSVCHAGYEKVFQEAGHPGAFLLGHAARPDFFSERRDRPFELGWVGNLEGPIYDRRRTWIPRLAGIFQMNDWRGSYTLQEVAEVYSSSRIVVNFSRDDFPEDANMRVFEVLASGALLVTQLPTHLENFGYRDGIHFVGYHKEDELASLLRRYLKDELLRTQIAEAGREHTRAHHTYESRVTAILGQVSSLGTRRPAPARNWPKAQVRLAYLDFFSAYAQPSCAWRQFRGLAGRGFRETVEGTWLLAKAWVKQRRALRHSSS